MTTINLDQLAIERIRGEYEQQFGPLDQNLTTNDIDYHICEIIRNHKSLVEDREEVHSWIVCAGIATPEDMMQNAERIAEITKPLGLGQ